MEKSETKRTKRNTLQITYPAPYSQSWNPDVLPVLMKTSGLGRSTRSIRPLQSSRAWSQQFSDRPDPRAPHLKYGVFRNRGGSAPRSIPKGVPMPKQQINSNVSPSHKKNSKQAAQKKPERKKSNSQFPPIYVIRSKDNKNVGQLSRSKTMHMDIKPKRTASPSFCPSPNFRSLSRKVSPRRLRLDAVGW